MDFSIPAEFAAELEDFDVFLKEKVSPNLPTWNRGIQALVHLLYNLGEGTEA